MGDKILKVVGLVVAIAGFAFGMATILATLIAPMLSLENKLAFILASTFLITTCICVAFTILEKRR